MRYPNPTFKPRYENFIGGEWKPPVDGEYFEDLCPIDGSLIAEVPRSQKGDVDLAVDAAWKAFEERWRHTSPGERASLLNRIADRIEENLERLAAVETWENGKPIRETLNVDIPMAADHFRYFAAAIRTSSGEHNEIDPATVSLEVYEPLGVVGQIIPWNFPILMAAWKLAPALAAGNCVVLKPAEQTPVSVLVLMELIGDLLPPGVVNIVNGFGPEAGRALATHPGIRKLAFTGETTTGRLIMQYASENLIPVTLELGGKSPNIFLESLFDREDELIEKAVEGMVQFAFNQGEVCTCPSRALIQESIYDRLMPRVLEKVEGIKFGDPLDTETMIGAQASRDQYEKVLSYIDLGRQEGAELLVGGEAYKHPDFPNGFYIRPTIFKGHNRMRIFQEEIFGPVLCLTTFKDEAEALQIANDTLYGLGAGVWTRDIHQAQRLARGIEAGRVWINCYNLYPVHASFGGYKKSGIGRECHKRTLDHYRQIKNIIYSYEKKPLGLY